MSVKLITDMISVGSFEFMGDTRLSFLVDYNVKGIELIGQVMRYNFTNSKLFFEHNYFISALS